MIAPAQPQESRPADLLYHSTFICFPAATPDVPLIRHWVARDAVLHAELGA